MEKKYFIAPSVYEQQKRLNNSVFLFEVLNNFLRDSRKFFEWGVENDLEDKKPYTQETLSKDLLIAWFKVKKTFFDSGLFESIDEVEAFYPLIKFSPFLSVYNKLAEFVPALLNSRVKDFIFSETTQKKLRLFYRQYVGQCLKEVRAYQQVVRERQKTLNKMVSAYYETNRKNDEQMEFYCFKFRLHIPEDCLWVDFYQTMQVVYKQLNVFFIANDQAVVRGFVFDPIAYQLELRFVTMCFNRFSDKTMLGCLDSINSSVAIEFELFESKAILLEYDSDEDKAIDYSQFKLQRFFQLNERSLWQTHILGLKCFQVLVNKDSNLFNNKWEE